MSNLFEDNGAEFSTCRRYRHSLWRIWDKSLPMVMFIGLNPSTANEHKPDPTITRVIGFANSWGYGGVYMMNLFELVSPKPEVLKLFNPGASDNDRLKAIAAKCDRMIFAWGAFKEATARAKEVTAMFPGAYCLKKNRDGSPIHPLYVKGDTLPILF